MFPRLRRILFHTAAAGSAFALLAVVILWPLSYVHSDALNYGATSGWYYQIYSTGGRLWAEDCCVNNPEQGLVYDGEPRARDTWSWSYTDVSTSGEDTRDHTFLGCVYWAARPTSILYPAHGIIVPYSYLAILSAIIPAIWLLTRKRRRDRHRLAHGLCLHCAYDLRAHHPGDKCPECGTPVPPRTLNEPLR